MYRSISHKRILLTGASSGIGQALALEFARQSARLLITARRADRLEKVAIECRELGAEVHVVAGGVTDAAIQSLLMRHVESVWGGLDVLVNNAGVGAVGSFSDAAPERLRQIMEVNFFAPALLIQRMLPQLVCGDQPIVVNIGSVLGHIAVPQKSEYCASKFALRGLSDALRCELRGRRVDLLWVAPNTTRSEFFDRMLEHRGTVAVNPLSMTPQRVAKKVLRAIQRGRTRLVLTVIGRNLIRMRYLFPRLMDRLLTRL